MKITRIDTIGFVRSLGMSNSFISQKHKLEYVPELQCYRIDDTTLLPLHRIAEVVIEPMVSEPTVSEPMVSEPLQPILSDLKELKKKHVK